MSADQLINLLMCSALVAAFTLINFQLNKLQVVFEFALTYCFDVSRSLNF